MSLSAAQAFLLQARADYRAFEHLRTLPMPMCHWLHFLQMSCEKLAKAYQAHAGVDFETVSSSHIVFRKYARVLYREYAARHLKIQLNDRSPQLRKIDSLARQIEQLHPAGSRTPNTEYPWKDENGHIISPLQFDFDVERRLTGPEGKAFLKFISSAIGSLGDTLSI